MKSIKIILLAIAMLPGSLALKAQSAPNIPEAIFTSLRTGDSDSLAQYFNTQIELILLGKEGIYSKNAAEVLVRDFFTKNPPLSYTKKNESSRANTRFAIGELNTVKGRFRIYFLMKNINGTSAIYELRIQETD